VRGAESNRPSTMVSQMKAAGEEEWTVESIQILATGGEGVGVAPRQAKRMWRGTSDWDESEESEMRELGEVTPAVARS
jgi:hypothetical protein